MATRKYISDEEGISLACPKLEVGGCPNGCSCEDYEIDSILRQDKTLRWDPGNRDFYRLVPSTHCIVKAFNNNTCARMCDRVPCPDSEDCQADRLARRCNEHCDLRTDYCSHKLV